MICAGSSVITWSTLWSNCETCPPLPWLRTSAFRQQLKGSYVLRSAKPAFSRSRSASWSPGLSGVRVGVQVAHQDHWQVPGCRPAGVDQLVRLRLAHLSVSYVGVLVGVVGGLVVESLEVRVHEPELR